MKKRILFIYGAGAAHVATTYHYVDAFRRHSRFDVHYLCIEDSPAWAVDLSFYDAIWVNYCARLIIPGHVPDSLKDSLAAYRGPKLVAVQDEYDDTNRLHRELRRVGSTVVLTCVPQQSLEYAYPRKMFPDVRFETVLTGYVSEDLLSIEGIQPLSERHILVGYRGRDLSCRYGELARQKAEIGVRVREACLKRGITCDIAVDEASRIYGSAWFEFIRSCRVMLGSESGSNIFDFDGSVAELYRTMRAADPDLPYERFYPFIAEREKAIDMGQMSPRMFEAAALRTAMVLVRGKYSGLLKPDEHYIPLESDYSNLDCVLQRIDDLPALEAMVERAYRDLIASDAYSYRSYVRRIDDIFEQEMRQRRSPEPQSGMPALASNLVSKTPFGHDPYLLRHLKTVQDRLAQYDKMLITANEHVDRLLKEVKMYGEVINQVGKERNRALEEHKRLVEENRQLRAGVNSILLLKSILRVSRLTWLCRIAVRKLRNSWRQMQLRTRNRLKVTAPEVTHGKTSRAFDNDVESV
jgi:hypothetical protein